MNKLSRAERGGLYALAILGAALCLMAINAAPDDYPHTAQEEAELHALLDAVTAAPPYVTDADKLAYLYGAQ